MSSITKFICIDGNTAGNPVRVVISPTPKLEGNTMMEKRIHFLKEFDWIRKGLMFEPRGHDMMSGSFFFPTQDASNDVAVLFIETSGCLPMCGHGLIGTITILIEEKLVLPKEKGILRVETPAGLIIASYTQEAEKVTAVKFTNIASFLYASGLEVEHPELGKLKVDVAYGGNFYAIVDPQANFKGIEDYTAGKLIDFSKSLRILVNELQEFIHPEDSSIQGCSHVLWAGKTLDKTSTARNAVFYGDKAIDRSPCGTGTSARMAQWFAQDKLKVGSSFIHESIIGSTFNGTVEQKTTAGSFLAIIPSIEGSARITGYNTIIIDSEDPYAAGFQVI
ncbi:4-hydroxyproline epimerase [Flavobacteriaceae bacterium]|nr:4-hydroxyproline epimerase [Flavobacteriaceae bacterium]MDC1460600.1 4-hydroxyproline epimerase [Flavobacteriaceae bacterium]